MPVVEHDQLAEEEEIGRRASPARRPRRWIGVPAGHRDVEPVMRLARLAVQDALAAEDAADAPARRPDEALGEVGQRAVRRRARRPSRSRSRWMRRSASASGVTCAGGRPVMCCTSHCAPARSTARCVSGRAAGRRDGQRRLRPMVAAEAEGEVAAAADAQRAAIQRQPRARRGAADDEAALRQARRGDRRGRGRAPRARAAARARPSQQRRGGAITAATPASAAPRAPGLRFGAARAPSAVAPTLAIGEGQRQPRARRRCRPRAVSGAPSSASRTRAKPRASTAW